jgi:imidazole glycerol phosphate synthase subunit HisF
MTSIDHDGTGRGYDLELLEEVIAAVKVSVVASKGADACSRPPDAAPPGAGNAALAKRPKP